MLSHTLAVGRGSGVAWLVVAVPPRESSAPGSPLMLASTGSCGLLLPLSGGVLPGSSGPTGCRRQPGLQQWRSRCSRIACLCRQLRGRLCLYILVVCAGCARLARGEGQGGAEIFEYRQSIAMASATSLAASAVCGDVFAVLCNIKGSHLSMSCPTVMSWIDVRESVRGFLRVLHHL